MPAGLGFIVQAILGMMGSQSLLHVGALSVRSSCVLYLVVVSMVVLSQAILCPVVREWWALGRSRLVVGEVIWVV